MLSHPPPNTKRGFMKQVLMAVLLVLATGLSALQFAQWQTSMGDFTCKLYDDIVPITAGNFVDLANSGFYNDLIFHRVVQGFVIQDGCPLGTGYGGPGYTIPDEFSPLLNHNQAGTLAMARTSAPNSAGSQYYITLAPTPNLNGNYAVFGQVIEGLDTVLAIGEVPVDANDRPITPVNIHQVTIVDLDIGNLTPPNDEVLQLPPGDPVMFIVETTSNSGTETFTWFIGGMEQLGENLFIFETTLDNDDISPVRCIVGQGDFSYELTWDFEFPTSNYDPNAPSVNRQLSIHPNPFSGQTSISFDLKNPGLCKLSLFDLRGRLLEQTEHYSAVSGSNRIDWQSKTILSPGTYLIRIDSPDGSFYSKITIQ